MHITCKGYRIMPTQTSIDEVFQAHNIEKAQVSLGKTLSQFHQLETAALLIDGPNFQKTIGDLGISPDFGTLFRVLREYVNLKMIYYFVGVSDDPHHQTTREQLTWLSRNGVRVVTRKSIKVGGGDTPVTWKGNMDIHIACTALTECRGVDTLILASGDGDFEPLVKAVRVNGQRTVLLSSEQTPQKILSDDLRSCVDGFIELKYFAGTMTARPAKQNEGTP